VSRTRVKICGITSQRDAQWAAEAGADAIGLVFYGPSKRAVSVDEAVSAVAGLPAFVTVVGLFVNAQSQLVEQACREVPLDLLQFHGDEPEDYCTGFGRPYTKAIRVSAETSVGEEIARYPTARSLLLDTWRDGQPGGTGESFDWSLVPQSVGSRIVLAGGLNADNVQRAIIQTAPYAVDVSGGVEHAPGEKSREKMRAFMQAVQRADMEKGD
jgi:phosphoribosylanthranilate isomerase